jgi:hypothetical protein
MGDYIKSHFPEDKPFELLTEGEHTVRVETVSQRTSKSGNDMVVFELKSIPEGQLLWLYCMNTGTNRWMLKKTIHAITGTIQPSGEINISVDNLLGRRLKVEIQHEMYQGKKQAKVADVIIQESNAPGQMSIEEEVDMMSEDLPF